MLISSYRELIVYQAAMDRAFDIFIITKSFPAEEKYSLTDQMRRSSRSVCANIAEAWRKRRYKAAFIAKLSDSETEAGETQVWLEISLKVGYIDKDKFDALDQAYNHIISQLVTMINSTDKWIIPQK